jgi:hypothetical protein
MGQRKQLVATRLNPSQRAAVFAVAQAEGRSVSSLLRSLVLPEVGRRLAALSAAGPSET